MQMRSVFDEAGQLQRSETRVPRCDHLDVEQVFLEDVSLGTSEQMHSLSQRLAMRRTGARWLSSRLDPKVCHRLEARLSIEGPLSRAGGPWQPS